MLVILFAVYLLPKINDETFGNATEWYREKNKYLRMGIRTSISYLGVGIIRESLKILKFVWCQKGGARYVRTYICQILIFRNYYNFYTSAYVDHIH